MTRAELDDKKWADKMTSLTVVQIEERFRELFHREMSLKERNVFSCQIAISPKNRPQGFQFKPRT